MQNSYLGVDGCRSGWFIIQLSGKGIWKTALAQNREELEGCIKNSKLALIDIPIGLPGIGGYQRECDQLARNTLGMPRAASVFSVPSRPAVYANSYMQACRLNYRVLGKKLSKQSWNITAKIREIDELLDENTLMRTKLRECHPEVCYWALNNEDAMRFNKKTMEGREERLSVLSRYFVEARTVFHDATDRYLRKDVALDDVLDAMVMAVTAVLGRRILDTLPDNPKQDNRGLNMEIVYYAATRYNHLVVDELPRGR